MNPFSPIGYIVVLPKLLRRDDASSTETSGKRVMGMALHGCFALHTGSKGQVQSIAP
jgi:hypothetical protein